jgi:uncharacterized membrane protein
MSKDVTDMVRDAMGKAARNDTVKDAVGKAVRDAAKNVMDGGKPKRFGRSSGGPLSGGRGVVAGAGLAALAPLAAKGAGKAMKLGAAKKAVKKPADAAGGLTSKLGDSIGSGVGDKVKEKVDESGGLSGVAKDALPFGGSSDDGGKGAEGTGKGRRMPIQQSVDVAVPVETAYNQWTQFEEWPNFMHRVTRVTQEDDCTVSFATKIWGKTKEFTAKIETQRPDERIKWSVSQGITHTGVVTFHELAPRLTRIELDLDVAPGSLIEKAARGMRHIKRAARSDLHRFKAFIEMQEQETGAWRGVIEDGELEEEHDPSYDEDREYTDPSEAFEDEDQGDEQDDEDDEEEQEESRERRPARAAARSRSRSSRATGSGSSRGRTRAKSSGSSGGRSKSKSSGSSGGAGKSGRSRTRAKSSGSSNSGKTRSRAKSSGSSNGSSASGRSRSGSGSRSRNGASASSSKGSSSRSRAKSGGKS